MNKISFISRRKKKRKIIYSKFFVKKKIKRKKNIEDFWVRKIETMASIPLSLHGHYCLSIVWAQLVLLWRSFQPSCILLSINFLPFPDRRLWSLVAMVRSFSARYLMHLLTITTPYTSFPFIAVGHFISLHNR